MTKDLPTEVLLRIFERLDRNSTYSLSGPYWQPRVREFLQYQLVCKHWRNAAQTVFYKDIDLGSSGAKLARTLRSKPHIGTYVKRLTVHKSLSSVPNNYSIMDTVLRLCPNIRDIIVDTQEAAEIVSPCLLQDHVQLKHIESFLAQDIIGDTLDDAMTPFVLLKFCKSLTYLDVNLYEGSTSETQNSRRLYLLQNIKKFIALEKLYLSVLSTIPFATFDRLLDDCSPKMTALSVGRFDLYSCRKPLDTIKPQPFIQSLGFDSYAYFCEETLQYLDIKFPAVTKMTIEENMQYPDEDEDEDEEAWWRYFLAFCRRLKVLTFSTKYSANIQYQMEKVVELASILQTKADRKCVFIDFMPWDSVFEFDITDQITFDRKPGVLSLDINSCKQLDMLFWMEPLAPHQIKIKGVANMRNLYNLDYSQNDMKAILEEIANRKSLTVLANTLNTFGHNKLQSIQLGDLVLCGASTAPISSVLNMSKLIIENSIITDDFLPQLSSKLPQLDTLELDTCSYIMDEPYNLKICLPLTRLDRLGLQLQSFSKAARNTLSGPLQRNSIDSANSKLENHDLMSAVSSTGRYTLKIETDSKIRVFNREGGKTVGSQRSVRVHGTKENFLIWIKCQELKEFGVASDYRAFKYETF